VTTQTEPYSGAPAEAIRHHYDLGNEFFALWLDQTRTYSCALWEPGDTLEQAQERKLDYLIEQAGAGGAERVLDIGCGWGSLMHRLVDGHGVERVVGLTLSDQQAAHVRAASRPEFEVHLENWADHVPSEPYDAIISIGAFEHFARYGMPREERVAAYRRFFARCLKMLAPGGRLALQTNAKGANTRLDRQTISDLRFIIEAIFPDSELPWLSEIALGSERLFELLSLRNDAEHYALTCAEWLRRLQANRGAAEALVGPAILADYERYLSSTIGHFERGHLALLRLVFRSNATTTNGAGR
jgi:cyclopropane-fatty-acyl-phospholipid synthase